MRAFQRSGLGLRPQPALCSTNARLFREPQKLSSQRGASWLPAAGRLNQDPHELLGSKSMRKGERVWERKRGGCKPTFLDALNNRYRGGVGGVERNISITLTPTTRSGNVSYRVRPTAGWARTARQSDTRVLVAPLPFQNMSRNTNATQKTTTNGPGTIADLPYDGSFCQPRFVTLIICKSQGGKNSAEKF